MLILIIFLITMSSLLIAGFQLTIFKLDPGILKLCCEGEYLLLNQW